MALVMPPATAHHADRAIVLPGATGTEGVARLDGSTFFAGDLLTGDVFRGDLARGRPRSSSTHRTGGSPPA